MLDDVLSRFKSAGILTMRVTFSGKQSYPHEGTISNQIFWPEMDLTRFSEEYRIPNDLDEKSVAEHLVQGMTDINFRLSDYRTEQQAAGYDALEEVPAEQVDEESILLVLYRRAVFLQSQGKHLSGLPDH